MDSKDDKVYGFEGQVMAACQIQLSDKIYIALDGVGIKVATKVNKSAFWKKNDLLPFVLGIEMSGILSVIFYFAIQLSGLNGSNSNLPDNTGRAFTTLFSAQSGSSGAVLNQSGGNIQGLHNIHGSFNMSNMPGTYASRNSANLGGLPNGIQQAPGSVSNGRYAINGLPNSLSQLSLGSSHGHSGVTNTGGSGVLPNMGNTGRITNSIGGLVGGGNTSRGASSTGVANIPPGLASRLNLTAPQVVSMLNNSYSGAGVPLSQNQFQAGNNNFSFMALLNDSNAHDNATFDVNDFPQLSGRPPSAGGSHGQIGGLNVGGSAEYTINAHQKEQIHDSMANLMQPQQLSAGNHWFGSSDCLGTYDLLMQQYQQFQQSQTRFINSFRDKDMKSTQGSQSLPDQYGMLGLLSIIKMVNPALTSLALGIDLTTLGLNLNSSETLHKKFASPWSDEPVRGEPEYSVPECYYAKQTPPLKVSYNRGWFYHRELRLWFTRVKNMEPLVKTNSYERGCYFCFDPNTWQTARKDNFVLQYEMVEKRPALPQP
ncbi:hypothetical protein DH2020_005422 [Rehmannia glutinosa]|uniref:NOT2/NOT3/NOT5 C-terminal domain-containing protein n=1 Tax=Rehmannia glutinosa TaxID=99300 RepID=A0ABR0XGL9_REHGL